MVSVYQDYESKVTPLEEALSFDMNIKTEISTSRLSKLEVLNTTKKSQYQMEMDNKTLKDRIQAAKEKIE